VLGATWITGGFRETDLFSRWSALPFCGAEDAKGEYDDKAETSPRHYEDQPSRSDDRAAVPIYTFLIEHDEALILVDTGESARASASVWFPWWSPFFDLAIDIDVKPEEEIGPRLRSMGIEPVKDLRMVVMTHLHHDHATLRPCMDHSTRSRKLRQ
jgi:hypothetical protein